MYFIIFSQYWLPDPATKTMEGIIYFFRDSISFMYVIGIFVFWITLRCIMIFYNKDNYLLKTYSKYELGNFFFRKISYYAKGVKHFPNIEFIWTIIPALILIMIGIPSFSLLYYVEQFSEPTIILKVEGHQWYWHYSVRGLPPFDEDETEYLFTSYMVPTDSLISGQLRLLEVDTRVLIPAKLHIQVIATSVDVIHCWSVPAFGMKLDCCPGRLNETMLYVKRPGIFYGQCSEICGMNHAFMPIVVNCRNPVDFVILAEYGLN